MSASRLVARASSKPKRMALRKAAIRRLEIARKAKWARAIAQGPITSDDITPLNIDTPPLEKEGTP